MPEDKRAAKSREFLQQLQKTGAVDFDRVGEVVKQVGPQLFDPGLAASDYIAKGYESVIHVWEIRPTELGLEQVSKIRDVTNRITKPIG